MKDEINYNIFNALNLHSDLLGQAYLEKGWSPLDGDFILDVNFILKFINYSRFKQEDICPSFLEAKAKTIIEKFALALKNNKELIDEMTENDLPDIPKEELLFFLKCRQKMIEILLNQIKNKKIDPFLAYKKIKSINSKLSQYLDEEFYEEFNKKAAMQNLIFEAQKNTVKDFSFKAENYESIEKEILSEINKTLEQTASYLNGKSPKREDSQEQFTDYIKNSISKETEFNK